MAVVPPGAHQDAIANGRGLDLNPIACAFRIDQRPDIATVEPPRLHLGAIRWNENAKNVAVIEVKDAPAIRPVVATPVRDVWYPDEPLHQNSPGNDPGVNCPAGCGSLIKASATSVAEIV